MSNRMILIFASASLCAFSLSTQAAGVALNQVNNAALTAKITPDANESGTRNVYMGAIFNGNLYLRGISTSDWRLYRGGPYPVAGQITVSGGTPAIATVANFDISSLHGLDVYVAYGSSEADISKAGHLAKIYSVPTLPGSTTVETACDAAQAPVGVSYNQSGNTTTVTTNGQCIPLPATSICRPPAVQSATGASVLSSTNLTSFSMGGISVAPGLPNPFDLIAQGFATTKSCVRNVPSNYSTYTVNMDVCYDITSQLGSAAQSIPGVMTVTPPITERLQGNVVNTPVADCFATDATSVVDALTNEVWAKQNGSWVKIQ
jgi:hypothetical protein